MWAVAAGQGEPTTPLHITEPLALQNFLENKDNEVEERATCLILEIIIYKALKHCRFCKVTQGDPAQRSVPTGGTSGP